MTFATARAIELVIAPEADPDELRDLLAQALTRIENLELRIQTVLEYEETIGDGFDRQWLHDRLSDVLSQDSEPR